MNLKSIVDNSYLAIINLTLDRLLFFESKSLFDHLIRIHVEIKSPEEVILNSDEELIMSHKFMIFQNLWKSVLEKLHQDLIPHESYTFDWTLEVTPYTMMLCDLIPNNVDNEIQKFLNLSGLREEDIENSYDLILNKLDLNSVGISDGLRGYLPDSSIPEQKIEQLKLIFRLMSFPPISELTHLLLKYEKSAKRQLSQLSKGFKWINPQSFPALVQTEPLKLSYYHVHHMTFEKYGFKYLEGDQDSKHHIDEIIEKAKDIASQQVDNYVCPCCGEVQEVRLPEKVAEYLGLLDKQKLAIKLGLLHQKEFTNLYKENLGEYFTSFFDNINYVEHPKCLILVEGESEEWAIPILAFRSRFILALSDIKVYNSKSKEKLAADFFSNKLNYPDLKIICLLDSDASKQRDDIERVIVNDKNKYRVIFINNGTFEDVFNLQTSIEILNEMYPDGESIVESDFIPDRDFLSNVQRFLFSKKKAKFDKVLFAKKISFKIDIEYIPSEIREIINLAKDFTAQQKFIKN